MGLLKKDSFTLTELIMAMALGSFLVLALAYQFVGMSRFGEAIKNEVEPSREAYVVINTMANILRFAKSSTVNSSTDNLTAIIEPNHTIRTQIDKDLPNTYDVDCAFYRDKSNNELHYGLSYHYYTLNSPSGSFDIIISRYCTYFSAGWDSSTSELTLKLVFTRNGVSIPVETKIKALAQ